MDFVEKSEQDQNQKRGEYGFPDRSTGENTPDQKGEQKIFAEVGDGVGNTVKRPRELADTHR